MERMYFASGRGKNTQSVSHAHDTSHVALLRHAQLRYSDTW
jgi:hypothetical protein